MGHGYHIKIETFYRNLQDFAIILFRSLLEVLPLLEMARADK